MEKVHLPVLGEGSLGRDGRRRRAYPADVTGRFVRARRVAYALLIAFWVALPWTPIGGPPAVFLDVEKRQFFLFGLVFNAQDVWLLFFLLTGVAFALLYATALLGRVWCGWACPQTVFLEALFRPIERVINGPRATAMRRAQGAMTFDRAWRMAATYSAYLVASLLVAHILLAYFVSIPRVFAMVRSNPAAHPEAFGWMLAVTGAMFGNFAFFREQLCVVICPYGRLQSVLLDDDSLVVGYDDKRGEPRGKGLKKAGEAPRGDCVECGRCTAVCPTSIDIRQGLQLDCIACTACIDACDEVMVKLDRPRGLIRYDSLRGLRAVPGEKRRILRPRIIGYTVLLVIGATVATFAFRGRAPFEANLIRLRGAPYTREAGTIRNAFEVHVVNKRGDAVTFDIEAGLDPDLAFVIPIAHFDLEPLTDRRVPVFVTMEQGKFTADRPFSLRIRGTDHDAARANVDVQARSMFLGARP
jgi:cytochrome c oxidase accessory protein FixG